MQHIVLKLIQKLKQDSKTLCVAESCTGGYLSYLITSVNGASDVYKGGVTTYSIESKKKILKVSDNIFEIFSVYSTQCVESMAFGALDIFNADIAIATSGLATNDFSENNFLKLPAGLVFTCVIINNKAHFLTQNYLQDSIIKEDSKNARNLVQKSASKHSLKFLLQNLN